MAKKNGSPAAAPAKSAPPSEDDIIWSFQHHQPDEAQAKAHDELRLLYIELAKRAVALTPAGRPQALMMTQLEQAAMWGHKAIACEKK